MTTDLAPFNANQEAIAQYLGLNPRDPKSHAVMVVCERYKLDPILKHVIVIPKGGVYVTRDGLLHVAHMSGQLDGIVMEEQGENDAEWWAEVSVYRKDMRFPFKFRGRYSKHGANKAYGPEMALKCAEALALRRAFDITGLPVLEERDAAAPARVNTERLTPKTAPKPAVEAPKVVREVVETVAETVEVDTETGEIVTETGTDELVLDAETVEELPETEPETHPDAPLTATQSGIITAHIKALGFGKAEGLAFYSATCERPITATRDLTRDEADMVIAALQDLRGSDDG
ncbi:MAG: hypothetical protein IPH09_13050 [bacterium]|nr:hypothetical protein [bacterium]